MGVQTTTGDPFEKRQTPSRISAVPHTSRFHRSSRVLVIVLFSALFGGLFIGNRLTAQADAAAPDARMQTVVEPLQIVPGTQSADGRSPTEGYRYRETEAYYIRANVPDPNPLAIKKQANVTTTVPGGIIEYKVSIHNTGNVTAPNVTMIDPIPAGTTFVTGSATATQPTVGYDPTPMQVKWQGDIPPGSSVAVTFNVQVNDNVECSRAVANQAAILGDNNAPLKSAEATVRVNCPGEAALAIKKQSDVTTTVAGGMVEYTITIQNSGSITADNVTMIDPIPLGTTFVSGTLSATAGSVLYDLPNN